MRRPDTTGQYQRPGSPPCRNKGVAQVTSRRLPMISQRLAKSGIVMALVLATGANGNAQSVVAIREGTFTVDDTRNNSMYVSGTQGFRFDGSFSLARAQYEAIEQCWLPECAPGTVV